MRVARLLAGQKAFSLITTVRVRSQLGLRVLDCIAWTARPLPYPES